jgi:hypothetical protein
MLQRPCHAAYVIFPRLAARAPGGAAGLASAAGPSAAAAAPRPPPPPPLMDVSLSLAAAAFPEVLIPGRPFTLIGVDPDVNGALATLRWADGGALLAASTAAEALAAAEAAVHDMPVEVLRLGTRDKRQACPAALAALLRALAPAGGGAAAAVEHSTPQHLSGKHAWYGIGYSSGLLSGLLAAQGLPWQRVSASGWKRDMALHKRGKEGSLSLAARLFPAAAAASLTRKKDHGRAEALLIAAWAAGVRAHGIVAPADEEEGEAGSEEEEEQ